MSHWEVFGVGVRRCFLFEPPQGKITSEKNRTSTKDRPRPKKS